MLVNGGIERTVTVNLVALRGLQANDGLQGVETKTMRTYLLALALIAATAEMDMFLREGCHLRYDGEDQWVIVPRRGKPSEAKLETKVFETAAKEGANHFRAKWPKEMNYTFDVAEAKKLLAAKDAEEQAPE